MKKRTARIQGSRRNSFMCAKFGPTHTPRKVVPIRAPRMVQIPTVRDWKMAAAGDYDGDDAA